MQTSHAPAVYFVFLMAGISGNSHMTDSAYAKGIGGDYLGDNRALPHIVDAKLHAAG